MTLNEIIEMFKDISVAHPEINSFHTGLNFEHNDSNIQYPALRMVFPYDLTYKQDNRVMEYTFKLTLFVNDVKDTIMDSSKYLNTNYLIQDSVLDESIEPLTDENKMRDRALGIMNNVLETLKEQENCKSYLDITNYKIKALERKNNDFVTGVSLTFTLRTDNSYRCEYPDLIDCNGDVSYDTTNPCPQLPEPLRYSMEFNGTNQYVQISQNNTSVYNIDWQQPMSFEGWFKPSTGTFGVLWSKITVSAGIFVGTTFAGSARFQIRSSGGGIIDVYSPVNSVINDEWNHIVVNYNGGGGAEFDVTFIINGVTQAKPNTFSQGSQITGGSSFNTQLAELSRIPSFGIFGGGKTANVRLWKNVELSEAEALTLYNGGKVLYDNLPQESFLLFDTGLADEGHSWYGSNGWIMEEISKSSNFLFGVNSDFVDRNTDIPS